MALKSGISHSLLSLAVASSLIFLSACDSPTQQQSQQPPSISDSVSSTSTIQIDSDDIAGIVSSSNGPEAGVWVIAETEAFETRFAKIVVTDDQGRYLLPDLPDASYKVWVRGYGLADSAKIESSPGSILNLTAVIAPDRATAAEVYPAAYWYSMMRLPEQSEVAHLDGGMNRYIYHIKNRDCIGCHQLGQKSTRTIPASLGNFDSSQAAWGRRIASGQAGNLMLTRISSLGGLPLKYLADWTDRIATGELPHTDPDRPAGTERNVVVTIRDWMSPSVYVHDLTGTDLRNPTINGYGKLYGSPEHSTDDFPILDPVNNIATSYFAPVRDDNTPDSGGNVVAPSPYWDNERIWDSRANSHNPMMDQDGRVWYTATIRTSANPDFCKAGSDHPSAQLFPMNSAGRHLAVYEPDTGEYTFVDTCFGTHHLQFGFDEDNTLWVSRGGEVAGWLNTRMFDQTGDAAASQGWSPFILDTNGNGVRDEWVEPDDAVDPAKDKRIRGNTYAVMPNPADGSVWYSTWSGVEDSWRGGLVRFDPATGLSEFFEPPLSGPGFGNRGADIDSNGVVYASMGSGHLGEFDRRKCAGPLNGPEATGDHCPEGWTFHDLPGPGFINLPEFSVESSYYTWVDQHNTSGLGADVPIATGNLFDGVHALVEGKFVTLRVPYPLGFYTKGFQGRIDDPDAGWKGRGLWVPGGDRTPWLMETGKGTKPLVVHFQVRPDPLAK